jgi:hypothetical protein
MICEFGFESFVPSFLFSLELQRSLCVICRDHKELPTFHRRHPRGIESLDLDPDQRTVEMMQL